MADGFAESNEVWKMYLSNFKPLSVLPPYDDIHSVENSTGRGYAASRIHVSIISQNALPVKGKYPTSPKKPAAKGAPVLRQKSPPAVRQGEMKAY